MVGLFSSCSDSFFEAESGDIITSDQMDEVDPVAGLNGMYAYLYKFDTMGYGDEAQHYDYGYHHILLCSDLFSRFCPCHHRQTLCKINRKGKILCSPTKWELYKILILYSKRIACNILFIPAGPVLRCKPQFFVKFSRGNGFLTVILCNFN